tara:strand:- start:360 stop:860 length:501 start_codon:yes stop_codon:yes gene_type:complete
MILKGSATNITSTASTFGRATRIRVAATNAGTVTIAQKVITFNAASDVDGVSVTATAHGMISGDRVVYSAGGGTAIAELTEGESYYIYNRGTDLVYLAPTAHDAIANTNTITLTDGPSENHTLTAPHTHAGTVLLVANDVIILDKYPTDTIAADATMSGTAIGSGS